ncbi:hypothetical protein LTR62_004320 [Meristemomyces frigidus]|uniref:Uncharacterized protein n=1 Tax=Meristemomyces frigidus TaxID=1508187 RepID=A0AAN7THZ9_9PEZI|nr:hypothetical protein LTR62_004320 [Meristemomyces frigidus]
MGEAGDLKVLVRRMQEENKGFAEALQRRDSIHKTQQLVPGTIRAESPLLPTRLNSTTDLNSQQQLRHPSTIAANIQYYRAQMAEAALTKNGRSLKAKATTKVMRLTQVCWNSASTRPLDEILRQLLRKG